MATTLETLLLLALPASGKSEVRRYLAGLDAATCTGDFHLGETVQLDDFPYVHLMRRISQELKLRDRPGIYFASDELPFLDARDWGTLIELLNEDYADLVAKRRVTAASAAEWLFGRFDAARAKVGAPAALAALPAAVRGEIAAVIEPEAAALLRDRNANIPETLEGKTVLLEFARGGPDGSSLPLPAPYGYAHSLSLLSPELLANAAILYVWVTPEESRRKNRARANPDDPGSILHHGVPDAVMYGDYGCDDIAWLLEHSGRPNAVKVEAHGRVWHLPLGRFDNRVDKTSFVREERAKWAPADVAALHAGLKEGFDNLWRARG
jgi:hypothetical protein